MSMDNTESSEDDEYLLNQVLNNLYDFGDGVASETKQKKKKRKRRLESKEEEEEVISQDVCKETEHSHPEHLALNHSQKAPVKEPPRIQKPHVEVVTFEDPRKKIKVQKKPTPELKMEPKVKEKEDGNKDDPEEMTFEKARLEVHRFGIRGYKKEQQRSFEQERAIMLGAKAPKKQYVNYKTLQQDLQEKKKKAREEVQPEQKKKKGSKQGDKMQQKKKKKAGSGAAPSVFGSSAGSASMGRFKGGMLMLSSKEIQKINGPG